MDYVYLWVDGIHVKVRLDTEKICLLVMIGVRADGTKELVALADGFRESAESWADLLRDCKRRGCAPRSGGRGGALGFWKAVRDVFPATAEQRCWFHKIGNVLAALPKSARQGEGRRWRRSGTPRTCNTPRLPGVRVRAWRQGGLRPPRRSPTPRRAARVL
ncbi:MAG: transposase [Actinomycetales bacterium]|nr:transposase [Candidatus Phosphoribacter baldrii]